jgi:type VI secretion system protein ImpE
VAGVADQQTFDDIRDLDDRLAGVLEVITTTGKYYWVPWRSVKVLEFHPAERPVDLIWRKASIEVENGPEGDVFIPVRYPNPSSENWDEQLRLGRATTWLGDEGEAVVGIGQRMLLIGEEAKAILDVSKITISTSEPS